jgi:predicted transposase/invertase (TIGR01784 family)
LTQPTGGLDFRFKAEDLKRKAKERRNWKFLLVQGLYEKGYNGNKVKDLFRFIDWIMVLPEKLDNTFGDELKAFEQEKKMTFITSVERIGIKKGREEERQKIVVSMLKKGVSMEDIAEFTELSIEQVKKIQSQEK